MRIFSEFFVIQRIIFLCRFHCDMFVPPPAETAAPSSGGQQPTATYLCVFVFTKLHHWQSSSPHPCVNSWFIILLYVSFICFFTIEISSFEIRSFALTKSLVFEDSFSRKSISPETIFQFSRLKFSSSNL